MNRFFYKAFRMLYAIQQWRRMRLSPAGILTAAAMAATAVMGLDIRRSMTYQVFTFLAALILLGLVLSRWFRPRFTAERSLPACATAGQPLTYRVTLRSQNSRPVTGWTLHEAIEDPRPSLAEFLSTPEPGEQARNRFDRRVGYYRWSWLISRKRLAGIAPVPVPPCHPGMRESVTVRMEPAQRGVLRLAGLAVTWPEPLGLVNGVTRIPLPQSVTILPRRYPVPAYALPGIRRYQTGGVSLTSSVGDSEEFISLRDYRPGDPLRRIHWKSWARLRKPVVKEFRDEYFVRHALVLDTFQAAAHSDAFEEAVSVAASFACTVQSQESLLDLMFVGPEFYCFTAGRGVGHLERILEVLATVRPCQDRPFDILTGSVLARSSGMSGCICVFLNYDEARQGFVRQLRAAGLPLMVLVIDGAEDSHAPAAEPGPMSDVPSGFHRLSVGRIPEGLMRLAVA